MDFSLRHRNDFISHNASVSQQVADAVVVDDVAVHNSVSVSRGVSPKGVSPNGPAPPNGPHSDR